MTVSYYECFHVYFNAFLCSFTVSQCKNIFKKCALTDKENVTATFVHTGF